MFLKQNVQKLCMETIDMIIARQTYFESILQKLSWFILSELYWTSSNKENDTKLNVVKIAIS